jgi:uncharacterized protein YoxC
LSPSRARSVNLARSPSDWLIHTVQAVSKTEDGVASGLSALTQCAVELIDAESTKLAHQLATLSTATETAAGAADKALKRERVAVDKLRDGVDSVFRKVEESLRASVADVESASTEIVTSVRLMHVQRTPLVSRAHS